ncbi:MAG: nuclear transport factor 2 family protein [Saonia sp.]
MKAGRTIHKFMAAYNERNLEEFVSYMHPEFKSYLFESQHCLCSGIADARKVYGKRFSENKNLFVTTLNRIVNDNIVVESQLIEGFDGDKTIHAIAIFELQNGMVKRASFVRREVEVAENQSISTL